MLPKKIMIVDDDPDDVKAIGSVLEKEGYEVQEAGNSRELLDFITENSFDLILLDIMMPSLSGYDLLRLLRERLKYKIKIIYISVVPEKEVTMKGIDGFIQKPFSPESLLEGVRKVLGDGQ